MPPFFVGPVDSSEASFAALRMYLGQISLCLVFKHPICGYREPDAICLRRPSESHSPLAASLAHDGRIELVKEARFIVGLIQNEFVAGVQAPPNGLFGPIACHRRYVCACRFTLVTFSLQTNRWYLRFDNRTSNGLLETWLLECGLFMLSCKMSLVGDLYRSFAQHKNCKLLWKA